MIGLSSAIPVFLYNPEHKLQGDPAGGQNYCRIKSGPSSKVRKDLFLAPKRQEKPPVQLGVNKKLIVQKKTSCAKIEVVWRPHD